MSSTNSSFDPTLQNITLLMADGMTPVNIGVPDIDAWIFYSTRVCMNFGAQMGSCIVMLFVVALLTKPTKRRTPVYFLNLVSLVLGALRALLYAWFFWSPWDEFYAYFSSDYSKVPRGSYATSVAGSVIPLLMTITVTFSLMIQAQTVCKVMTRKWYILISIISALVFLFGVGFRLAETITNSRAILQATTYYAQAWIQRGALICNTISIWWFSAIFTSKLLWTLYARRAMGFAPWSPMQILMVMGGCTMIIPSLFAILEYVTQTNFPEAGTLCLTLVALLLPLSSLWASMVTTEPTSNFYISQLWSSSAGSNISSNRKTFGSDSSGRPEATMDRKDSEAQCTMTTVESVIEPPPRRDSTELDLERLGVRVDRSYIIQGGA